MAETEWAGTAVTTPITSSNGAPRAELTHAQFLRIALETLSLRVTRWVTLLMAFGLFLGAVWYPDWRRLTAAAGFTVLVYLPLLYAKRG